VKSEKENQIPRLWGLIRLGSITIRYGRLQSLAITLLIYIISNPSATSSDFFFSLYPAGAVASARRGSFLFKNGIQQKRKGTQVGGGIFNS
jgi:hypothetical protein